MTKNVITDVLFKGRFYECWFPKGNDGGVPLQNISNSQVCLINNNRALIIARSVLLVEEQEIEVNLH